MIIFEMKHKLRQLKKLEAQIRFKSLPSAQNKKYIWNEYFTTKDESDSSVRYNMKSLLEMDHERLKAVFDEYFYNVYFQYYKENGIAAEGMYDTSLLATLGLPPNSSMDDIKSKFRELAKKHHPDLGGDSDKFIELINIYKKLIGDQ